MCNCQSTIAILKKGKVERHFQTVKKYETDSADQLLAPLISCYSRRSAVSLAMLIFLSTYSILCGLSIIAPQVLPPPQPQGYLPPGCFIALLCCCGLPQLEVMLDRRCSAVAGRVFRCSAQELLDLCCHFTPGSIAGIGSFGLLRHSRCVHGASRHNFVCMDNAIPSVQTDRRCWGPSSS